MTFNLDMNVLVTGGSGYLGTHVRKFFNADSMSRRVNLDILNAQAVATVRNYDMVVHLAAQLDKSPEAADQVFLTNVQGTVNLLKEMKENAVFIFASTKDVYGRFADNHAEVNEHCQTSYSGQSALEWSKLIAERYVEYYANTRNFRSCIFRLSTVYAPRSEDSVPNFVGHFADAINKGEPLRLPGEGLPTRDLLHIDDLSAACAAFEESVIRHGLYNLGGGAKNAITLSQLIVQMEKVSGLQAVIDEKNPLPAPVPMNYVTDLNLVTQELGWSPTIGIAEGLKSIF